MYDSVFYTYPVVDMTVPLEGELPVSEDSTTPISTIINEPGGPANILIMGKRLGLNILPVGYVGDDYYGHFLLDAYRSLGIDTSMIAVSESLETSKALCLVDNKGKHAYISMLSGRMRIVEAQEELIENARSLCVSGYMLIDEPAAEELRKAVYLSKKKNRTVFFDPGPVIDKIGRDDLNYFIKNADIILLNLDEACELTGSRDPETACRALSRLGCGKSVVKLGAAGCYVFDGAKGEKYGGFKVPLVDTVGAGDSFWAAFMKGIIEGWTMKKAAVFANAAGAAKAAKRGSGTHVPTLMEIFKVLKDGGYAGFDAISEEDLNISDIDSLKI